MAMRPKTLGAAWVPVISASLLAHAMGLRVKAWIVVFALLSSLMIQIATNLFNDAIDFKKGADTGARIGPTRVTASGLVSIRNVYFGGIVCVLAAIALGVPLVIHGGLPILVLGLVSVVLAYSYTGGPFPLAYLGLGDIFVFLFFGLAAVLGTYFLQTQILSFPPEAWILASQLGCWATVLIAINNFRDAASDRVHNKMTLSARFGAGFSRIEISLLLLTPYIFGYFFWSHSGWTAAAFLPLLTLPISLRISLRIWRTAPSKAYNQLLAQSGAVHMLSGLLLGFGFYLKLRGF
jgi:1,4-dihydroxy-2-naphthoate octaprenyltransferase